MVAGLHHSKMLHSCGASSFLLVSVHVPWWLFVYLCVFMCDCLKQKEMKDKNIICSFGFQFKDPYSSIYFKFAFMPFISLCFFAHFFHNKRPFFAVVAISLCKTSSLWQGKEIQELSYTHNKKKKSLVLMHFLNIQAISKHVQNIGLLVNIFTERFEWWLLKYVPELI